MAGVAQYSGTNSHSKQSAGRGSSADRELWLMLAFTRRLPRVRGAVRLALAVRRTYLRKPRQSVIAEVLGFRMRLDPTDWVEVGLLFYPQLWDHTEISFLTRNLFPGEVFLDIGSHAGFNALVASRAVGPQGMVVAVEADPDIYSSLCHNLALNQTHNVRTFNLGISDADGLLRLGAATEGNLATRSFLSHLEPAADIECITLSELVRRNAIRQIKGAWLDICGLEFRVLAQYFSNYSRNLYPDFVILEDNPGWRQKAGGDAVRLLEKAGYKPYCRNRRDSNIIRNCIMVLT